MWRKINRGAAAPLTGERSGIPATLSARRPGSKVEEIFGWMKTVGLLRKLRHRGRQCVGWIFTLTAAAYNLVRIRNLVIGAGPPLVVGPGAD